MRGPFLSIAIRSLEAARAKSLGSREEATLSLYLIVEGSKFCFLELKNWFVLPNFTKFLYFNSLHLK